VGEIDKSTQKGERVILTGKRKGGKGGEGKLERENKQGCQYDHEKARLWAGPAIEGIGLIGKVRPENGNRGSQASRKEGKSVRGKEKVYRDEKKGPPSPVTR